MSNTQLIHMECPSCGGPLQVSPDGILAKCGYCGSTTLLQQPAALIERLKDFPNASLNIRHSTPTYSLKSAREKLIELFSSDPIGFRSPKTLDIKVEGHYVPYWYAKATIHCSWHGNYSETRTVTKYRTAAKERTIIETLNGKTQSKVEKYTEQEPYADKETVWHPYNGSHDFPQLFMMPANGYLDSELGTIPAIYDPWSFPTRTQTGFPAPPPKHTVHPAIVTQREAWEKHECPTLITEQANRECESLAEKLSTVAPNVAQADFTLMFLPYAVITYFANAREYRHLFDLTVGFLTGDMLALDHTSVNNDAIYSEAHNAHASQTKIEEAIADGKRKIIQQRADIFSPFRKLPYLLFIPALHAVFRVLFSIGHPPPSNLFTPVLITLVPTVIIILYAYWTAESKAGDMARSIEATFSLETPWRTFVTTRRIELLRLSRIESDRATVPSQLSQNERQTNRTKIENLMQLESESSPHSIQEAESIAFALYKLPQFQRLSQPYSQAHITALALGADQMNPSGASAQPGTTNPQPGRGITVSPQPHSPASRHLQKMIDSSPQAKTTAWRKIAEFFVDPRGFIDRAKLNLYERGWQSTPQKQQALAQSQYLVNQMTPMQVSAFLIERGAGSRNFENTAANRKKVLDSLGGVRLLQNIDNARKDLAIQILAQEQYAITSENLGGPNSDGSE